MKIAPFWDIFVWTKFSLSGETHAMPRMCHYRKSGAHDKVGIKHVENHHFFRLTLGCHNDKVLSGSKVKVVCFGVQKPSWGEALNSSFSRLNIAWKLSSVLGFVPVQLRTWCVSKHFKTVCEFPLLKIPMPL